MSACERERSISRDCYVHQRCGGHTNVVFNELAARTVFSFFFFFSGLFIEMFFPPIDTAVNCLVFDAR